MVLRDLVSGHLSDIGASLVPPILSALNTLHKDTAFASLHFLFTRHHRKFFSTGSIQKLFLPFLPLALSLLICFILCDT